MKFKIRKLLKISLVKTAFYNIFGKRIFASYNVIIKGYNNIYILGRLKIGLGYVGFILNSDKTYLNINGRLDINGNVSIGRGCRFDIGKNARVYLNNCSITAQSRFIIMHELYVGNETIISCDCEFLDEDFHEVSYLGKKQKPNKIFIGDHVWIGSGVKVLKGSKIGNNVIVAANSVVSGNYPDNVIISGNPAKIIKYNAKWN